MKKFLFVFILIFTAFFGIFFLTPGTAQEVTCPSPPSCPGGSCGPNYQCVGTCGGKLQQKTGSYSCWPVQTGTDDQDCPVYTCQCGDCDWGPWTDVKTCQPWQICNAANQTCSCSGSCLETPKNPRYYDNTNYPTDPDNPEEGEDLNSVFLPVKLDWDDVEGWKDGWKEDEEKKECPEDCVKSYVIRIETAEGAEILEKVLDKSKYNLKEDEGPCFLKSNTTHQWKVVPCCNSNGTNCKSWNDVDTWSFKTNLAPELISPVDPDWNGPGIIEDIEIPATLDWCDVEEAEYYKFRAYLVENGVETCHPLLESNGACYPRKIYESTTRPYEELTSKLIDGTGLWFVKDTEYRWEIATCFRDNGAEYCSNFGQKWGFKITSTLPFESFELLAPPDDPLGNNAVGLPIMLKWENPIGINSFVYEIGTIIETTSNDKAVLGYPDLSLDTVYSWRARPCSDYEAESCESWTPFWNFKTTGAPPTLNNPANGANNVLIPVEFDWEDISGANSYKYQISNDASFNNIIKEELVPSFRTSVDYPDLEMDTNYWWRVQTCADEEGNICGVWSSSQTFRTFEISVPTNPFPADGTVIEETTVIVFSWDSVPGAKAYQYVITYTPTGEEVFNRIAFSNSVSHLPIEFPETGVYNWKVRACLDRNCQETSGWSSDWSFNLALEAPPERRGGLVPCGRDYDDPDTPWNEREFCQTKHLFLLLRNILDFLLWRLAPIILVLLVVGTGLMYYFSLGSLWMIVRAKSMLRAAIIGYLVIFFAWSIINLILAILGYQIGFFGKWWEIKF